MCFGGSTQTSKVVVQKPTGLERQAMGITGATFGPLLDELGYTIQQVPGAGKKGTATTELVKRPLTPEEQATQAFQTQWQNQARTALLGGTVPPDVQAYIQSIFDTRQNEVQQQINRAAIEAAGSRGLNLSDTPIGDPYLRTTAEAAQNLRAAQAQALLGARTEELNRAGGIVNYLDQLRQLQRFQNPMSFANYVGNLGLGLYGARMAATRTTSPVSQPSALGGIGSLLGGAGGFLTGLGPILNPPK